MARKVIRKAAAGRASGGTTASPSSPASTPRSVASRASRGGANVPNSTQRASMIYQVYDPIPYTNSTTAAAASNGNAPTPSHKAVAAAVAALANPTGYALPHPLSPSTLHGGGGDSGRHAKLSTTVSRRSGANAESSATALPLPAAPDGSYANENPRLVASEPPPVTSSSSNSQRGKSMTAFRAKKRTFNYTASRRKGSGSGNSKSIRGGGSNHTGTVEDHEISLTSGDGSERNSGSSYRNQNGSTVRGGSSGGSGRPRARSLPRSHNADFLPRLRPTGGAAGLPSKGLSAAAAAGAASSTTATSTLRLSPPTTGVVSPSSSTSLRETEALLRREVVSAPPTSLIASARRSPEGNEEATALRKETSEFFTPPPLRSLREGSDVLLNGHPHSVVRAPAAPQQQQPSAQLSGRPRTPSDVPSGRSPRLRATVNRGNLALNPGSLGLSPRPNMKEQTGKGGSSNGGGKSPSFKLGEGAATSSSSPSAEAVATASRQLGGWTASAEVTAPPPWSQLHDGRERSEASQDVEYDDDDAAIWGDADPNDVTGSNDSASHRFGSAQLLATIHGDTSDTPHLLQQPRQPPIIPLRTRPSPGPANPPPQSSPLCADGAAQVTPAYKFNVVLSSGKTATVPISLVAGSGCVQGMRPTMEDAHFMELNATHVRGQPVSLLGVLDGHCGRRVADLGAKWLPHYLLNHAALGENNALALVEAILQTDREIFYILQACKQELEQQRKSGNSGGRGGNARRRRDVAEEMFDESSGANGGSTLIAAAVCGRMLYVACLGDARAVLYDGQTTIAMSEDHKPGNPDENRRIGKCGGFVQFGRVCGILAVSRALGDFEFKFQPSASSEDGLVTDFPFGTPRESSDTGGPEAESAGAGAGHTSTRPASHLNKNRFISNRDLMVSNVADVRQLNVTDASAFLLLACDGLWDVLSNEEATEFVRDFLSYTPDVCDPRILTGEKPRPSPDVVRRVLNNCCQKLTEFAVDRGSMDNVSAMVLFFHDVVDTVARFNGRQPQRPEPQLPSSAKNQRSRATRHTTSSSLSASSLASLELTNNQMKMRNGRVVANH